MIKKDEICEAFTQMDSDVKNDSSALIEIPEDMTSEAPEAPEKKRKQSAAEELTNCKKSRDDTGNATSNKCQISTECDHCKVHVPPGKAEVQFDCKICNVSVQLFVKPLDVKAVENENRIARDFQENFEFQDVKTEIKDDNDEEQQKQSDNHREIWTGELSWKNPRSDSNPEQSLHNMVCTVTAQLNDEQETIVRSDNWPKKLIMQIIPKNLVQQVGGQNSKFFEHAPHVLFQFNQSPSKDSLTQLLSQGYVGCVHFQSDKEKRCNIKVLILTLKPSDKNTYVGFIPNEQLQFVDCIRKVIQQEKDSQRVQQ